MATRVWHRAFMWKSGLSFLFLFYFVAVFLVAATVSALRNSITSVEINGDPEHRLPGTVNLSFKKLSGEVLVNLLSLKGICISASSACAAAKNQSSHVLRALGLSEEEAKSSVRISYGRYNSLEEGDYIVEAIAEAYKKIVALGSE